MLIASIATWLQIALGIASFAVAIVGLAGAIVFARWILRSRQMQTNSQLADSAIASLQGANQGLESRLDLVEAENRHCAELKAQQDKIIEAQGQQIADLREWVTARDLVVALDTKMCAGLEHLGVPAEKLRLVK